MTAHEGLADASDLTFMATIFAYALAMFAYAVEYSFGRRGATKELKRERELVGVGAGGSPSDLIDEPSVNENGPSSAALSRQAEIAGRIGLVVMVLGVLAHASSLGLRAAAVGRWPWGNMFEFIVAVAFVGITVWTVLVFRKVISRKVSLFAMLGIVLMLGAATRVYTDAGPLVPALDSYWIAIHVLAAILASGTFLVGFIAAVLHLVKRRYTTLAADGKTLRFPMTLGPKLPDESVLERLTWRMHVLAFPLWTFAVMAGAIWAREAWSRYWGWDPKEIWSFIAWVVYAAYLHARVMGPSGKKWAPWIAVVGWAVMLFNLYGVNLIFNGLHSYSGL